MESSAEMELLETLVKRIEPKPSWYVTVNGKDTEIVTNFSPPLTFPHNCNYEIACCSVETFYSFPNIDQKNNSCVAFFRAETSMIFWRFGQKH